MKELDEKDKFQGELNSAALALHRTRYQTGIDENLFAALVTTSQSINTDPETKQVAEEILKGFFATLSENYKKIIKG